MTLRRFWLEEAVKSAAGLRPDGFVHVTAAQIRELNDAINAVQATDGASDRKTLALEECFAAARQIKALTARIPEDPGKAAALICHMADRVLDSLERQA